MGMTFLEGLIDQFQQERQRVLDDHTFSHAAEARLANIENTLRTLMELLRDGESQPTSGTTGP